ncbi:MAG TPA: glycosyltransferase family 1 protein, partial [Burkholderiaceae bacterium]|nr:glycosyltransferase family 1 protein [Burkholderiaceae bacterium]
PVVARAAAGLRELVDDDVGAAVHGASADDFAQAISTVINEGHMARSLAARRRACGYDWTHVLPRQLALYRALMQGESFHQEPTPSHASSHDMYRSA